VTIGSVCHKKTVETTSWGNIEITMPNGLLSRKSLPSTLEGAPPEDSAVDQAVRAAQMGGTMGFETTPGAGAMFFWNCRNALRCSEIRCQHIHRVRLSHAYAYPTHCCA
jgi:hypothetical protein